VYQTGVNLLAKLRASGNLSADEIIEMKNVTRKIAACGEVLPK
jgi:hypothetical protein